MRCLALILLLTLAACGRPLSVNERNFVATLHGPGLDPGPVRIVKGNLIGNIVRYRPARPQVACRERIWPAPETAVVPTSTAAFVLFQTAFYRTDLYRQDFLAGYPQVLPLAQAMLFAHEMTHVWQWQNRAITGYQPLRAASEHVPGGDPYLFDVENSRDFLDYSDEQQGALVEEFVCCRALDPEGERTQRLYDILIRYFPAIERRSRASAARIPWKDAQLEGICSD